MPTMPAQRPRHRPPHHIFGFAVAGVTVALAVFELLYRVLRVPDYAAALLVGLALLPALVWALVKTIASLLADPDNVAHALLFAFADLVLTIVLFAFLYLELGIVDTGSGREVTDFWTCLYFSASTITTSGLGDFVPAPETRVLAALEMVTGYVVFGILTAAAFFLLTHRSRTP